MEQPCILGTTLHSRNNPAFSFPSYPSLSISRQRISAIRRRLAHLRLLGQGNPVSGRQRRERFLPEVAGLGPSGGLHRNEPADPGRPPTVSRLARRRPDIHPTRRVNRSRQTSLAEHDDRVVDDRAGPTPSSHPVIWFHYRHPPLKSDTHFPEGVPRERSKAVRQTGTLRKELSPNGGRQERSPRRGCLH